MIKRLQYACRRIFFYNDRCKKLCFYFLSFPFVAAIISLCALIAGIFGSIWSPEIGRATPFDHFALWSESDKVKFFWLSALLFFFVFFSRQRADDNKRKNEINFLEQLIRTAPPKSFWGTYSDLCYQNIPLVNLLRTSVSTPIPQNLVAESIRILLSRISVLAQEFDGGDPYLNYAANVMIYKDVASLSSTEKAEVIASLDDGDWCIDKLQGVLILDRELSTTGGHLHGAATPDPAIDRLFLPIPLPHLQKAGELYRVLPGAALAFVCEEARLYHDTLKMHEWIESNFELTKNSKAKFYSYFERKRGSFRSFASIPLYSNNNLHEVVGILNIHCNKTGVFDKGVGLEPLSNFVTITTDYQIMLSDFLEIYA